MTDTDEGVGAVAVEPLAENQETVEPTTTVVQVVSQDQTMPRAETKTTVLELHRAEQVKQTIQQAWQ